MTSKRGPLAVPRVRRARTRTCDALCEPALVRTLSMHFHMAPPLILPAVSVAATCLIAILFVSEFRHYRLIETVDKLDVDVSSTHTKIAINLDITLPSLPCSEFVIDAVDASGVQQTRLSDMLNKLRIDRHGVPIDVPKEVDWSHTIAPAFRHRKVSPPLCYTAAGFANRLARTREDTAYIPLTVLFPCAGAQPAGVSDGQPARDDERNR